MPPTDTEAAAQPCTVWTADGPIYLTVVAAGIRLQIGDRAVVLTPYQAARLAELLNAIVRELPRGARL